MAGGQGRPVRVVVGVGRGDDDAAGAGVAEDGAGQKVQPIRLDMLDHFHQGGGLVARQAFVEVEQGAVNQPDSLAALSLQVQAALGDSQGGGGHVHADDLRPLRLGHEQTQELPLAAAQI